MTKHLLDGPQICTASEQVAGKRMAQNVWRNLCHIEPGFQRQVFQIKPELLPGQMPAATAAGKQPGGFFSGRSVQLPAAPQV